jgi:hypothetical protein
VSKKERGDATDLEVLEAAMEELRRKRNQMLAKEAVP